jgi:multicomponent K+:H+ antiporter subunit C
MSTGMEALLAAGIGTLAGCGVWLVLRVRMFEVVVGLSLISYAVNLFIFSMGRLVAGGAPILEATQSAAPGRFADPLPQALVLTAIVISFAMTGLVLALAVRAGRGEEAEVSGESGGGAQEADPVAATPGGSSAGGEVR